MVAMHTNVQRYGWPLVGIALVLVQCAPLALKIIGVGILCMVALSQSTLLLITTIATTPLYLIPVSLTTTAAIPLHEIVWGVAVTGWAITRWRQGQPIVVWSRRDGWVGALLLSAGITLLWALPEGRGEALRWLRWLIIEPIVWYLCMRTALRAQQLPTQQLVHGMLVSAGIVAGIGILQALGGDIVPWIGAKRAFSDNVISTGNIVRVASVYGHPNNFALFLERVWPFALMCVLIPQWRTRFTITVAILCAVGLLLSFSRGAWLACGLASVLIGLWVYGATLIRQKPWILGGIIGLGVVGIIVTLLTRGTSAGSLDARILLWQESLAWLHVRPWGLGLGQFYFYHNPEYGHSIIDASLVGTSEQYAAHPHNVILDLWLNLGPWGVVIVGVLLWHAWRRSLVQSRDAWLAVAAGVMLVAASVHGLVDQFLFVSDIAFCFWWALCMIDVDTAPHTRL